MPSIEIEEIEMIDYFYDRTMCVIHPTEDENSFKI